MNENESKNNYSDDIPVIELIMGDLFEGLAVSDYSDKVYESNQEGKYVRIVLKAIRHKPDRLCVGFLFLLDEPTRFRIDVLVPENCTNARVSLQGQELIGFFSPDMPTDPEPVMEAKCGALTKVSTLHPGEFQSINFKWESGDVLNFYFYFGDYTPSAGVGDAAGVAVT